ncbi:MAG: CaiB/BaiF CoA transferase family protein [Dehalococcoidia bacterium]
MDSALSGITIVDLATDIAGSYTCMLLGDMGADVIKVELADSPDWRGCPPYHLWNRGKKSIYLDLNKEGAREVVEALVARADVVVESFLSSQARAKGLDYDSLSPLNPRLIYCALPPFGEDGPWSDVPADDAVVAAFAGVMGDQNGEGQPPAFITVPASSYSTAFLASYAISSALYVRELEGIGQKIEIPLLNGAIAVQTHQFVEAEGVEPIKDTANDPQGSGPVYRLYECSDGKWIFIACGNQAFWMKLCNTLSLEEFLAEPRYETAPWSFQSEEDRLRVISTLKEIIKHHPQNYWLDLFDREDIPCAPADTRHDFVEDPQVRHNNMIVELEDPVLGATRQLGIPVSLAETPGVIKGPAPRRGEHGEQILRDLGYPVSGLQRLKGNGAIIC